jgi:hypothetical protein
MFEELVISTHLESQHWIISAFVWLRLWFPVLNQYTSSDDFESLAEQNFEFQVWALHKPCRSFSWFC